MVHAFGKAGIAKPNIARKNCFGNDDKDVGKLFDVAYFDKGE